MAGYLYQHEYGEAGELHERLFPEKTVPVWPDYPANESGGEDSIYRFGIWKQEGDTMARDHELSEQFHTWAEVERFPLNSDKKRVLLLGESVASGFLFDRHYRPADVLQGILAARQDDIDVLDLARLGLGFDELHEQIGQCGTLNPDALIVYAGNNWLPQAQGNLDEVDLEQIIGSLNSPDKYETIKSVIEKRVVEMASAIVSRLEEFMDDTGIPAYFVLPGYNLKDWKGEISKDNLLWPTEETEEWTRLIKELDSLQNEGYTDKKAEIARQLIRLQPIHPFGYELAGETALHIQDIQKAYRYYEEACETGMCRFTSSARVFRCVEETLKNESRQLKIIDLPHILAHYADQGVPGRDLFVDYCHHTPKGMQVAMSAVASPILLQLCGVEADMNALLEDSPAPAKEEEGAGHLLAAILNAHFDQSESVVKHHCHVAAKQSASARQFMKAYIRMIFNPIPKYLTGAFGRLSDIEVFKPYIYWHDYHENVKDIDLLYAMRDALAEAGDHYHDETLIAEAKGLEILNSSYDLFESKYIDSSYSPYEADSGYAAISPESVFYFYQKEFSEKDKDFVLTICLRTAKEMSGEAEVIIKVNGDEIARQASSPEWSTLVLDIPRRYVKGGYNAVTISWPTGLRFRYRTEFNSPLEARDYLSDSFMASFGSIDSIRIYDSTAAPGQSKPILSKELL
ncbi:MAG: hypothetical protein WBG62_09365 [Cyclobacteriaceae bacterium]